MSMEVLPRAFSRTESWASVSIPSSPEHVRNIYRKPKSAWRSNRPRSSPSARVSFQNQSGMNRPKTAAAVLIKSDCDRVSQLEHEATRRHNFESHIPARKNKTPPWQRNLDTPVTPFVVGPGYILSKSKDKYAISISTDEFFDPVHEENQKQRYIDPERDALIGQLQQQIADLSLYLEEERLNHRQTKQKSEEFMKDKLDEHQSQHQEYIRELNETHEEDTVQRKAQHDKEMGDYQTNTELQIKRLKGEVEFMQGAFESYKSSLNQEMDERWRQYEQKATIRYEQERQGALQDLKSHLLQEKTSERAAMTKEHQKELDTMRREHKKEFEGLTRRFSNSATDLERLEQLNADLEETRSEMAVLQSSHNDTCSQLEKTDRALTETKVRLLSFEEKFLEKVQEVDDKYKQEIHDLMSQNTELRRLYSKKCRELFDEKVVTENSRVKRVETAKEVLQQLIRSKNVANVSLVSTDTPLAYRDAPMKIRPVSAPVTKRESNDAISFAGQVETDEFAKGDYLSTPGLPTALLEENPEIEEMRKKLFEFRSYVPNDTT